MLWRVVVWRVLCKLTWRHFSGFPISHQLGNHSELLANVIFGNSVQDAFRQWSVWGPCAVRWYAEVLVRSWTCSHNASGGYQTKAIRAIWSKEAQEKKKGTSLILAMYVFTTLGPLPWDNSSDYIVRQTIYTLLLFIDIDKWIEKNGHNLQTNHYVAFYNNNRPTDEILWLLHKIPQKHAQKCSLLHYNIS